MTLKSDWAPSVIDIWATSEPSTDDNTSQFETADGTVALNGRVLPDVELYYDTLFELLSNQRRRWVVRYLFEAHSTVELGCIAEHLAAVENDKKVSDVDNRERKRTYVALYQCHLPKMADAGLIRYDSDRGTIAPGPHLDIAHAYLTDPSPANGLSTRALPVPLVVVAIGAYLLSSSSLGGFVAAGLALCTTFIMMMAITRPDQIEY